MSVTRSGHGVSHLEKVMFFMRSGRDDRPVFVLVDSPVDVAKYRPRGVSEAIYVGFGNMYNGFGVVMPREPLYPFTA